MNDLRGKIGHQFYIALERLGAPMELLACAGSYGDTLEDEDILGLLEDFNARVPRGDRPGEDVAESFSAWANRVAEDAAEEIRDYDYDYENDVCMSRTRGEATAIIMQLLHDARLRGYDEASKTALATIRDLSPKITSDAVQPRSEK